MTGRRPEPTIAQELKTQVIILGGLVAIAWAVEFVDLFVFKRGFNRMGLDQFGIMPRNLIGLRGILFAPFLHGGLGHLIGNTIPFLVLGWFIMLREISDFFVVTIISALASGLGTWLFGAPGIHIGASGVVDILNGVQWRSPCPCLCVCCTAVCCLAYLPSRLVSPGKDICLASWEGYCQLDCWQTSIDALKEARC
jgi:hypothetical protein